MARGWESKSIEAQIDMAEPRRKSPPPPAPDVIARLRKRESLQLSRTRIQHDLESARNPRYRELLRKTLADLDARLAQA
jgi:hypothetical protein